MNCSELNISLAKETKNPVMQDIFNNIIALKERPSWGESSQDYYLPQDRFGNILRNRVTTNNVEAALSNYIEAGVDASLGVTAALTKLSKTLCETGHLPSITQAAHTNLIVSTASNHASQSTQAGWKIGRNPDRLCEVLAPSEKEKLDENGGRFNSLWPYWMDKSEAVLNSFKLNGLFLLTAPNMSGKSTIMRSTAAAALLTNCGLSAPFGVGSFVRRFDSIFVRGASADVPTENKSAFGAEMEDIAALLRSSTESSLVFFDEIGRGTSPTDGTSLAGAVLEEMATAKMNGIFATHLHDILMLPLREEAKHNIATKRMQSDYKPTEEIKKIRWTYKLMDGLCTDSHAIVTAARFGIPDGILQRAEDFFIENENG